MDAKDRPLETLREETIDRLVVNYGHGKLSLDAFQRRVDEAFEAAEHETLVALTEDLDLPVDAGYIDKKEEALGRPYEDEDGEDVEHIVHIFSGGDRSGPWSVPKELRVITICGGSDIDFTDARFSSPVTRVKLLCLFGGVDIYVPEGMRTTFSASCIFGGVDNKAPSTQDRNAPRLIIEGFVMFGGADVKLKKTFKQRILAFADDLRTMFGGRTFR